MSLPPHELSEDARASLALELGYTLMAAVNACAWYGWASPVGLVDYLHPPANGEASAALCIVADFISWTAGRPWDDVGMAGTPRDRLMSLAAAYTADHAGALSAWGKR